MTKSGKSVVRLGSFNSNNKTDSGINFVDLTTLKLKQYEYESVNLFIWANSKLFLGNLSGGTFPPMLFGVPILWFDIFPYRHFVPPGINDKVLPKKLFSIEEGRMLSLNELFSPKYANLQTESPVSLSRKGFKLIDTTESEILDCLNEIYAEKQLILTSVERLSAVKQSTLNFDSGMDLYSKLPKTFLINNEQYSE
jgi:putative glycosyltransferase (TIGR04372 family)